MHSQADKTYPVLSKIYCRKASLADFLPAPELANDLIWLLFWI